jgi:hypothetical protein
MVSFTRETREARETNAMPLYEILSLSQANAKAEK